MTDPEVLPPLSPDHHDDANPWGLPHYPAHNGAGRPSGYTVDIATTLLDRVAAGEFVSAICRDHDMPSRKAVLRWETRLEEFRGALARARAQGADALVEKAERVLLEATGDRDEINRAKELAQHYRWCAAKLHPARYSERQEIFQVSATVSEEKAEAHIPDWMKERIGVGLGPQIPAPTAPGSETKQ